MPKPAEPAKAARNRRMNVRGPLAAAQPPTIGGDLMKSDGGVTRRLVAPSFDTEGTPFGAYDLAVIAAIKVRWFALLDTGISCATGTGRSC